MVQMFCSKLTMIIANSLIVLSTSKQRLTETNLPCAKNVFYVYTHSQGTR